MNNNWIVYKHTFPDGKIYIGVTGKAPEIRWDNGFGYIRERKIFNAIVSQGWNNVKHDILYSELSEESAKKIEKSLIQEIVKRCRDNVLNVQHNPAKCQSASWVNFGITEKSIKQNGGKFALLNDCWLEKYKQLRGCFPFSTKIFVGYIILQFFEMEQETVKEYDYKISYPDHVVTFRDLHNFLMTGATGEWVQGQHEAVL